MAVLYIVRTSPHMTHDLDRALDVAARGSHVLLVQDSVLAAAEAGTARATLDRAEQGGVTVHALREDLAARGIGRLAPGVDVVDYGGWVDLVEEHVPVTW